MIGAWSKGESLEKGEGVGGRGLMEVLVTCIFKVGDGNLLRRVEDMACSSGPKWVPRSNEEMQDTDPAERFLSGEVLTYQTVSHPSPPPSVIPISS